MLATLQNSSSLFRDLLRKKTMTNNPASPKLLPCPFCGVDAVEARTIEPDCHGIMCPRCKTNGPLSAWNTRAAPIEAIMKPKSLPDVIDQLNEIFLEKENRILVMTGVLANIARQRTTDEQDEEQRENADYVGAYDAIIKLSRTVFTSEQISDLLKGMR